VRAKKLYVNLRSPVAKGLEKGNRDRISFFTRSAARGPYANASLGSMVFNDGRENLSFEGVEDARIAEETGDVDEHVLVKRLDLRGIALKVFHVLFDSVDLVHHHAALNPAKDGGLAVVNEVHASASSQQLENEGQPGVFRGRKLRSSFAHEVRMACNAHEFAGDGFRRGKVIEAAA